MNKSLQSSPTTARLSVLPLAGALPQAPHLVAPERAETGDFVGVFGGICHRPDLGFAPETHIEMAYKKGALQTENHFIDEMSDADAAAFKEITAVPFCGFDHHRIVRQAKMVVQGQPYQIHLVQFADAILYVHPHWIQGIWGLQSGHKACRPLMMMLEGARSHEEAAHCVEKTKRYMKLFRSALPPEVRSTRTRRLKLPRTEDCFTSGGTDHAFVR